MADDDPEYANESRQEYCERVRRENAEGKSRIDGETRRRQALEARFGAQLDALSAEDLDALARATLDGTAWLYFVGDRTRIKQWLLRESLLKALAVMQARAAAGPGGEWTRTDGCARPPRAGVVLHLQNGTGGMNHGQSHGSRASHGEIAGERGARTRAPAPERRRRKADGRKMAERDG